MEGKLFIYSDLSALCSFTWYEKLGFRKMVYNTPGQDGITVSMFLDCMQKKDEFMEYIDSIYE